MQKLRDVLSAAAPMSHSERCEVCSVCQRRRGEHRGPHGTHCPDGGGYHRTATFEPSGEYADESPHVLRCCRELDQRRAGRVPVFRRIQTQDDVTGEARTDGFQLSEYVVVGGQ